MARTRETEQADAAPSADLPGRIAALARDAGRLREQIGRAVVGQRQVVDEVLIALLCGGHALLVGPPGLGRTLLAGTLAQAAGLTLGRIQFTPDMLPADVTGAEVFVEDPSSGARSLRFMPGPVFANLVLADEINRTPPKTQAALLEAMEEHSVTVGNVTHAVPQPFTVLATLNVTDSEGVYELPAGSPQLDRFMVRTVTGYPTRAEEDQIVERTTTRYAAEVEQVLDPDRLAAHQRTVRELPAARTVSEYAADLARLSRPGEADAPAVVAEQVAWGAGPRASQFLLLGAKARAAMAGRLAVTLADVRAVAPAVLRHRVIPSFHALAAGWSADRIVAELLREAESRRAAALPVPRSLTRLLRLPEPARSRQATIGERHAR